MSVPIVGSVQVTNDQTLTYTTPRDATGQQSITYQIDNGNGGIATAVITVEIIQPMTVAASQVTAHLDEPATNYGTIAAGANLSAVLSASIGTVTDLGDGTWIWEADSPESITENQPVTISVVYNDMLHDSITFNVQPVTVVTIPENTKTVTTVSSSAIPSGRGVTYAITGGADAALFKIGRSSGTLKFLRTPDFELPRDANADNTYLVEVTISKGAEQIVREIAVQVTNTSEASSQKARGPARALSLMEQLSFGRFFFNPTMSNEPVSPAALDAAFTSSDPLQPAHHKSKGKPERSSRR